MRWTANRIRASRGFTILELLAVVAVAGILIALLLPALGSARLSAAKSTRLASAHSVGNTVVSYAQDYGDAFPYLMTPRQPEAGVSVIRGWRNTLSHSYFGANRLFWPSIVFDEAADAPRDHVSSECELGIWQPVAADAAGRPCSILRSSLFMTGATAAAPEFWQGETFYPSEMLCVPMRLADTRFPSSKGLLLDVARESMPNSDDPSIVWKGPLVVLMDGSAGYKPLPSDTWTQRIVNRGWGSLAFPVIATRDGLRGRDF